MLHLSLVDKILGGKHGGVDICYNSINSQTGFLIVMHTSYTVGITTGQFKALETVMTNQKDWIQNAIEERARIVTVDIANQYTQFKINKGEAITAIGLTAIVEAAISEGVVGIAT